MNAVLSRRVSLIPARRLPTILPPMSFDEAIETTKIHSVAGLLSDKAGLIVARPFRAPHHTISDAGLIGGGTMPRPGEVSLAHNGVLFLDELPEFHRHVLDVLRQPLEDGEVTIARAAMSLTFPARFMLAAAMNPCQCGYYGDTLHDCTCTPPLIQRYLARVSGPLLDRIDLHIQVPAVKYKELAQDEKSEESAVIRERILSARLIQSKRLDQHIRQIAAPRAVKLFAPFRDQLEHLALTIGQQFVAVGDAPPRERPPVPVKQHGGGGRAEVRLAFRGGGDGLHQLRVG